MNEFSRISNRDAGASNILDLLRNPFQAQLAQTSVIASLGTSIGFTLLITISFSLLRPYNSVVYAPKLKVADHRHAPPSLGRGVFAWVKPLQETSEEELEELVGLDAVVFLRILAMCRNIFIATALVGCFILIPINIINGTMNNAKFIFRVTPINTFGRANWGMAICAWIFNFIICGFLWWNYRAILKLRRKYFDSPEYQLSLHARTLMLDDIPKQYRSDEGINTLIDKVAPTSSFSRTVIARNVKDLPELIDEHNKSVRELERYLAKYLKDPKNIPARRPKCFPSKDDIARDTHAKGIKLDAISYLTSRIKRLELNIQAVRLAVDNRNPLPYGFASYDAIEECHTIAFLAKKKQPCGTTIVPAPRPNDIIWKNMPLTKTQRRTRRIINNMWVAILTILWVAPNALISIFLMSLTNLGHVWKAFRESLATNTTWWSFVQGVASPAITSLVYLVLPIIFRRLAVQAGDRTKTGRERHVAGKLYTFFIFNFLFAFSMFSTIWNFVSTVINATNSGTDAWQAIFNADFGSATFISLCDISPFWITWLLQRNLGAAIDLAQLWNLIWSTCVRKFSNPTPREIIELTAPQAFDYASYYNYFLFYSTVTLCFAFLQPLILPACALYFAVDYYLKKYLLLYIFVTKIESGGMFWRMFYNRMVFATILSNLVVFLALWVHGDNQRMEAYTIVPLPFMMLAFKLYCRRTFDDKIHYYSTLKLSKNSGLSHFSTNNGKKDRLMTRFGHPALYRPLITPMVHSKAQNILPSVYSGRLTNNDFLATNDVNSISDYSDTYMLHNMQQDTPGQKSAIPGFEIVPENRLDFSYYKSRHEFSDGHGGSGGIFGKPEDHIFYNSQSTLGLDHIYNGSFRPRDLISPPISSIEGSYADELDVSGAFISKNDERKGLIHGAVQDSLYSPSSGPNYKIFKEDLVSSKALNNYPRRYSKISRDVESNPVNYNNPRQGPISSLHQK